MVVDLRMRPGNAVLIQALRINARNREVREQDIQLGLERMVELGWLDNSEDPRKLHLTDAGFTAEGKKPPQPDPENQSSVSSQASGLHVQTGHNSSVFINTGHVHHSGADPQQSPPSEPRRWKVDTTIALGIFVGTAIIAVLTWVLVHYAMLDHRPSGNTHETSGPMSAISGPALSAATTTAPIASDAPASAPSSAASTNASSGQIRRKGSTSSAVADGNGHIVEGETPEAEIGQLSVLGWGVRRDSKGLQFEVASRPLPDMAASARLFRRVPGPFTISLQTMPSLAGMHNLAGVTGLERLVISASDLTDIVELSGLRGLKVLSLSQVPLNGSQILDSSPLAGLIGLESLSLNMSRFSSIEPASRMTRLTSLSIGGTLIRDLSPLKATTTLKTVDVRDSHVSDLQPLAASKGLEELSIDGKQLESLSTLASLRKLKRLSLIDHAIRDLSPIASFPTLESVFIWGPPAIDLTFLGKLPNLKSLQISGFFFPGNPSPRTQVTGTDAICASPVLNQLVIGAVQITSLSFVARCTALTEINLSAVYVNSIAELSDMTTLKKISLIDVPVVDISPLLGLKNLESATFIRVPARADVLALLARSGVMVTNQ